MGGLKYYLLKVDPKKRMMYNPEESIELNGNTGPFIQYAYARIQSLITKSDGEALSFDASKIVLNPEEKEIIKQLDQLPAVIDEAARELSPALIANYTFELVKTYNSFYQSVYILNEPALDAKKMRLTLSKNVAKVIQLSMRLLGVEVPSRM
jgi:arginyl-tRNA synthetase